jgi:hypothetical protein
MRRGSAEIAFLPRGGEVRGVGRAKLDVPAGRSVVLTERATSIRSPGWVITAAPR